MGSGRARGPGSGQPAIGASGLAVVGGAVVATSVVAVAAVVDASLDEAGATAGRLSVEQLTSSTSAPTTRARLRIARWFPEVTRLLDTYPTVEQTCQAFAAAGFTPTSLEPVPQTDVKSLTDTEYQRGKHRLREAAASEKPGDVDLTSTLDLLVLR